MTTTENCDRDDSVDFDRLAIIAVVLVFFAFADLHQLLSAAAHGDTFDFVVAVAVIPLVVALLRFLLLLRFALAREGQWN